MIPLILGVQLLLVFAVILLIRRLNQMASRTELNTALDSVISGFTALTTAIAALKAAIAAGGDFQPELDKVTAISAALAAAIAQAS